MKKFFAYLILAILSLFVFNSGFVFAEEVEEGSQVVEQEEKQEEQQEEEKKDEIIEKAPQAGESSDEDKKQEQQQEQGQQEQQEEEEELEEEQAQQLVQTEGETPAVGVNNETPVEEDEDDNEESRATSLPVNLVKVILRKIGPDDEPLSGALLQVKDSNGNVVENGEWTSDGNDYILYLPNGKYTLHEVSAPEGYDKAADVPFTVEVQVEVGGNAETYRPNIPCETATTYTVTIKGEVYEVYCINQYLTEPGSGADYNGKILTPENIRNYTYQNVYKDPYYNETAPYHHGNVTTDPIDVSDTSLSNEELYNKLLDIIYRRNLTRTFERFQDTDALPDEAISYLTETALKMYTNAGVTQIQKWDELQPGEDAIIDVDNGYWYLMHMYRDYIYDPDAPNGFRVDIGHGDSFGNFARHWTNRSSYHGTRNLSVDHPIYAEFYYYLLGDTESASLVHPEDMYIYIYQATNKPDDDDGYQNLLGITGYINDFEQEKEVVMKNEYHQTTNIKVNKIWSDKDNYNKKRPTSVKVKLYADNKLVDTIVLNERNEWSYEWKNLDLKNENGVEIKYTIKEQKVKGYKTTIEGNAKKGFVIINTYKTNHKNPNTVDYIYVYVVLLLISLYGVTKYSYIFVKNK